MSAPLALRGSARRRFTLALTAATVIGLGIRLVRDHFSYGLDEILEAYWINGSWAFLWKSIRFDAVHPPLDYSSRGRSSQSRGRRFAFWWRGRSAGSPSSRSSVRSTLTTTSSGVSPGGPRAHSPRRRGSRPSLGITAGSGDGVAIAVLDLRSLVTYFREGRADWRTLGRAVRALPAEEPVFTGNQYSQLCTAFYGVGRRRHVPEFTRATL